LLFIIGGVVGSLVVLGLMIGLGMLLASATGSNIIRIRVAVYPAALPLAFSFVGWLELLSGVQFTQLSESFDKAQGGTKVGLTLLVIVAVLAFLALLIWVGFKVYAWLETF
jgi:hypothetical protein